MCILMSAYVDYPIGADEKEESLVRQGILLEDMIDNEFLPWIVVVFTGRCGLNLLLTEAVDEAERPV